MPKQIPEELSSKFQDILNQAIEADQADMGNIQLYDKETETLFIVAQKGFKPDFLEHFKVVKAFDASACGRALGLGTTIMINDVMMDLAFAPHREIAIAAGYRAVKSTPLISPEGKPLGVLSTHFKRIQWNRESGKLNAVIYSLVQLIQKNLQLTL